MIIGNNPSEKKLAYQAFFLVIGFSFLIFFAQTRSFGLLFDGLTYASISKNILIFDDWKTLHYDPVYYKEFYQHPPLAMWMQAGIYKVFGFSEPISRFLSAFLSVLSVGVVFLLAKNVFGLPAAVWSSVVLFTSTRFIKWSTNFYLDGIFAFFALSSIAIWVYALTNKSRSNLLLISSFVSGVLLSFAFMTKGLIVFGVALTALLSLLLFFNQSNFYKFILFFAGSLTPVLLWCVFANGDQFLINYFNISANGRAAFDSFSLHPWKNLMSTWLPWWPLFFLGLIGSFGKFKFSITQLKVLIIFALAALSFPVGFSFGKVYLEHYLTPFFPFAAIITGITISNFRFFSKISESGINKGFNFLLIIALFIATVAPNFHLMKDTAPKKWIYELNTFPEEQKNHIKQIAFSNNSVELWYGIAVIQGLSNLKAVGAFDLRKPSIDETLLITLDDESPDSSWVKADCFFVTGFKAYTSNKNTLCERH